MSKQSINLDSLSNLANSATSAEAMATETYRTKDKPQHHVPLEPFESPDKVEEVESMEEPTTQADSSITSTTSTAPTTDDNFKAQASNLRNGLLDYAILETNKALSGERTLGAADFNAFVAFLDKTEHLTVETSTNVNNLRETLAKKQKHSRLNPAPDTSEHDQQQRTLATQRAKASYKERD
ncbi:hypothetical protein [Vibrio parahaemolyticus]|uniref:hypothetical protein n=1 Tax=Vibrio parahaemolyticus TaxID=670 RepID=UPI00329994F9